jgi:para-aminobenzoate synthetase/4-amino-4-deoxychorismate lyase
VRFDDAVSQTACVFPRFSDVISTDCVDEVIDCLVEVERASDSGRWATGFVSYEAAPGLDSDLAVVDISPQAAASGLPLLWFGISEEPPRPAGPLRGGGDYRADAWCHAWAPEDYAVAFGRVRAAIAAGNTYQCNLTTVVTSDFTGDAEAFYADLARAQRSSYSAYLDLGTDVIASASPELFFEWTDDRICTRPMKGTARRGSSAEEDALLLQRLLDSEKERAENIIVVDLLRNDVSRIAVPGTVRVPALLTAEGYGTVWQLTSDVTATLAPEFGFTDILRALFPCGSVTGAPKIATMELIRRVEARPRGVYCGCIGVLAPKGSARRARFSVAIRTAHIDRDSRRCSYGVGSGVTWGSRWREEYAEVAAKCAILPRHAGALHAELSGAGAGAGRRDT